MENCYYIYVCVCGCIKSDPFMKVIAEKIHEIMQEI